MTGPQVALPPRAALLLDLDGTLLDIAPTPDSVVVPPDLPPVLRRLRARCGEALAVITGRPLAQVDALLGSAPYAVAAEHGSTIRHAPDAPVERAPLPEPPAGWLETASALVALHPGALVEPKAHGFVLHYRLAPPAGAAFKALLDRLVTDASGDFTIMAAHMAWEVRPRGVDKGTAVTALMRRAPFAGRVPVFIGDDVTDEDAMRVARAMGGMGLRVQDWFGDAVGVRAWLATLADHSG